MKKWLLFFLCFVSKTCLFSQEGENPLPFVPKEPVYDIAPSFPGGAKAMNAFFQDSIRYPADELKKRKEGYVSMKFDVTKEGKIIHIVPVNGVPGAPNFVKESIRLLNSMPQWVPATKDGKAVQAEYYLNIPFKLKGDRTKTTQKK